MRMNLGDDVALEAAPESGPRAAWRRLTGHAGLIAGGLLLAVIVLAALLAPVLAPADPLQQSLANRLLPPVWDAAGRWAHPLGTDALGRDYLSRLLHGARVSLAIGLAVTLLSALIGVSLGLAGGYFGGRVDAVVLYLITVRLAVPSVLVVLAVAAIVGGSLTAVVAVLGGVMWDRFAVVVRAAAAQARQQDYVVAARAFGASPLRTILREILPNLRDAIVVVATLTMAEAILIEAALSFLGLGVQPPTPAWGLMIAEGKDFMFTDAWIVTVPGVALLALVLAINLVGDGLRDVLAPEAR